MVRSTLLNASIINVILCRYVCKEARFSVRALRTAIPKKLLQPSKNLIFLWGIKLVYQLELVACDSFWGSFYQILFGLVQRDKKEKENELLMWPTRGSLRMVHWQCPLQRTTAFDIKIFHTQKQIWHPIVFCHRMYSIWRTHWRRRGRRVIDALSEYDIHCHSSNNKIYKGIL